MVQILRDSVWLHINFRQCLLEFGGSQKNLLPLQVFGGLILAAVSYLMYRSPRFGFALIL